MSKGKILVVKSDENIRKMIQAYLTLHDYEVTCVENSAIVLDVECQANLPDALIMDEHLAEGGTYKFWQKLNAITSGKYIPILYFMRNPPSDVLRDLPIMGIDFFVDYMTDPFDVEELRLRLERIIKESNQIPKVSE
jgi:DNA-binding response OmpR family regulator